MMTTRTPPPEGSNAAGINSEAVDVQELRRALAQQQQIIQQLQQSQYRQPQAAVLTEGSLGNYFHFSMRDALEAVPNFDGGNIPFVYFVEGCEAALSMVTPTQEINLVRAVRNKLKGDAHRTILGKTFGSMREFVEFLRTKYGLRETVYEAQGRLAYLCQKKDEKVITYANRVRELGKRILDTQKRETGIVSPEFQNSIEKHLKTSFLRGLNKEIIITKDGTFDEIESRAIEAEKELETVNMIRRVVLAENASGEKRASTRRRITCQYCRKKGHTADKCWQINKPTQALNKKRNQKSNPSQNNTNINGKQSSNSGTQQNSNNQNQNTSITCRYCKKPGHILEECRKRIYNNNVRQQNLQGQGNEQIPARTGATPGNTKIRPARLVSGEPESDTEQ